MPKKFLISVLLLVLSAMSNSKAMETELLKNEEIDARNHIKIHIWENPDHASLEIRGFNCDKSYISIGNKKNCLSFSKDIEEMGQPITCILYCLNGEYIWNYYKKHQDTLYNEIQPYNGCYAVLTLLKKAGAIEDLFPDRTLAGFASTEAFPILGGLTSSYAFLSGIPVVGFIGGIASVSYLIYNGYNFLSAKDPDLIESKVNSIRLKSLLIKASSFEIEKYSKVAIIYSNQTEKDNRVVEELATLITQGAEKK